MPYAANQYTINLLSEENLKKYVLPHFGMESASISQIKFKDTDKQRAVYKVEFSDKCYCLKKVYYSSADLLFIYSAMEWLYQNSINVPKLLPTIEKGRYANYNDMLFILTPWIDGEKCNYNNLTHILSSIENLAHMHKCSVNFKPIEGSSSREGFDDLYVSIKKHFNQFVSCSNLAFKNGDRFSKLFLSHFDKNLLLAETALSIASSINKNNLSKSLCHLDYVNKNIIFDNKNNVWVIDFDRCLMDYCSHDISYFLRRILKRDNTKWDLEMAVSALNTYEKVKPLSLDDYKYILVYLCFPQKFWKISRDYYNNINKCNKLSFYNLLNKVIEKEDMQLEFTYNLGKHIENKLDIKIT